MSEHTPASVVNRAIDIATTSHANQRRKGTGIPFIVHPMEAAAICARLTADEEVIAAAMLHDVVEDTDTPLEEIRKQCGDRVAEIVAGETEDKQRERSACDTWQDRKLATIEHMRACDDEAVLMVCLADKLSNMRSMQQDLAILGDALWSRFNMTDPEAHAWYYRSLCDVLEPRLGNTFAWRELDALIREVFPAAE